MKPTPARVAFAAALAAVALTIAACAGLDLGDLVRVKTPHHIQQQTGLPATTTLNDAQSHYRDWHDDVRRAGAEWKASIERSNEIRALLGQLSLSALDQAGPTIAGLPIAGPALPALTGILGLVLGAARLRKEKEASFNKGMHEATRLNPNTSASPTNTNRP